MSNFYLARNQSKCKIHLTVLCKQYRDQDMSLPKRQVYKYLGLVPVTSLVTITPPSAGSHGSDIPH